MSVEFWTNAERFYATGITILRIIIGIILIALHCCNSAKKENRLKIVIGLFISVMVFGIVSYAGHLYYQPYIIQAGYVNPLVRDHVPNFSGYNYFGRTELIAYAQFNDLESLRQRGKFTNPKMTTSFQNQKSG